MPLKNSIKTFLHILLWGIILILPLYMVSRDSSHDNRLYYHFLIKTGVLAILFYVNYLSLIDKFFFTRKYIVFIAANLLIITVLLFAQSFIFDLIMSPPPAQSINRLQDPKHGPPFIMRLFSDYLLIVLIVGMSVAVKTTLRWQRDSVNFEKVKTVQLEADLKNLRSQLNPHFLFNTLNNIYSLIAIDKNMAQESVHRLSNLLRYVLYDDDKKFVPIDTELEFTRNFIDLMKLRLSESVKLDINIESDDNTDVIAPLMFITLIENAFKHGIRNGKESFITINILVEKSKGVLCTVENSLITDNNSGSLENRDAGIGLVNLSKRLNLLYPGRHEFTIERRETSFFALLRIDF